MDLNLKNKIIKKNSMDCKTCQNAFQDYLSGKLDMKKQHAISTHVRSCRECMDELEAFCMFSSAFKILNSEDADVSETDVNALVKKKEDEYRSFLRARRTIYIEIIAAGLIIGGIIAILSGDNFFGFGGLF